MNGSKISRMSICCIYTEAVGFSTLLINRPQTFNVIGVNSIKMYGSAELYLSSHSACL